MRVGMALGRQYSGETLTYEGEVILGGDDESGFRVC